EGLCAYTRKVLCAYTRKAYARIRGRYYAHIRRRPLRVSAEGLCAYPQKAFRIYIPEFDLRITINAFRNLCRSVTEQR
ncbi:MAG: hypothetical protein LBJ47_05545, partial [Tannerella sp.]|nr:hypothetical protein [Tannerella sp.]